MPKSLNKTYENSGFPAQILLLAILTTAVKAKKPQQVYFNFRTWWGFFQISEFTELLQN
jgi:hypothetical protein